MDWNAVAIERNRKVLLRLVAGLFALVGLVSTRGVAMMPRSVRKRVLHVLRPAESAARRLIVVQAHVEAITVSAPSPRPARAMPKGGIPRGAGDRVPAFKLIDTYKRFDFGAPRRSRRKGPVAEPRIRSFDEDWVADPVPAPPPEPHPDDRVDAARLRHRLLALKAALDDLPKQAQRMARMMARRKLNPPGPRRVGPMRPGLPPGYRQKKRHEIDQVLHDCHMLALRSVNAPNTS